MYVDNENGMERAFQEGIEIYKDFYLVDEVFRLHNLYLVLLVKHLKVS